MIDGIIGFVFGIACGAFIFSVICHRILYKEGKS